VALAIACPPLSSSMHEANEQVLDVQQVCRAAIPSAHAWVSSASASGAAPGCQPAVPPRLHHSHHGALERTQRHRNEEEDTET
jgi:hypothetical protein